MVVIKEVSAKSVLDSREEKTIEVTIKTNVGVFLASAPNGKSRGKKEKKPYKKNLDEDIKAIKQFKEYFSQEIIDNFVDLRRLEDILEGHVGANTVIALEYATLKALAKEQKKQIWQLINLDAKKVPRFVGNCIGGGKHSSKVDHKVPDFQEFLLIPDLGSAEKNFNAMKDAKKKAGELLKKKDNKFNFSKNDENAWITSLSDKDVLDILTQTNFPLGLDIAASGFYKRKKYSYKDPMIKRTPEEQITYISNLIKNFNLFYVEDPFGEEEFDDFAKLLKAFPRSLIVGDDLIVTSLKRLQKAVKDKSINAIIVKPNQCGSLIEVKNVCEFAKKHKVKLVFSHRSGETDESILADLAFGFGADFLKCGITGKEREVKIKRLIEIEKSLK